MIFVVYAVLALGIMFVILFLFFLYINTYYLSSLRYLGVDLIGLLKKRSSQERDLLIAEKIHEKIYLAFWRISRDMQKLVELLKFEEKDRERLLSLALDCKKTAEKIPLVISSGQKTELMGGFEIEAKITTTEPISEAIKIAQNLREDSGEIMRLKRIEEILFARSQVALKIDLKNFRANVDFKIKKAPA